MGTPETSREPCPDRILDDIGGAFAMGAIGGSVYHFAKGCMNTPKGERLVGGIQTMRMSAPRTGGGFAVWGGLFSTFDCGMVYIRQKEDPWNSIFAGAATGGFLQMRQGLRSSAKSAAFGGVLLALIEGAGIMVNRLLSPPPQINVMEDHPSSMPPVPPSQPQPQPHPHPHPGFFRGFFGLSNKDDPTSTPPPPPSGAETKVLDTFDSPPPMPTFEYK